MPATALSITIPNSFIAYLPSTTTPRENPPGDYQLTYQVMTKSDDEEKKELEEIPYTEEKVHHHVDLPRGGRRAEDWVDGDLE